MMVRAAPASFAASRALSSGPSGGVWFDDLEQGSEAAWIRRREADDMKSALAKQRADAARANPDAAQALVEAEKTALAKILMKHQLAMPAAVVDELLQWKYEQQRRRPPKQGEGGGGAFPKYRGADMMAVGVRHEAPVFRACRKALPVLLS